MNDDIARKVMLGSAIAAGLGAFLPWATVFIASVNGIETDYGKCSLAAAVLGAALLAFRKPWWWQALLPLASGGFGVWFWIKMSRLDTSQGGGFHVNVQVGSGVYLTIAASCVWWLVAMNTRETTAAAARARQAAEGAAL